MTRHLTDNSGNSDAARIQAAEEGRRDAQREQGQASDRPLGENPGEDGDDSVGG